MASSSSAEDRPESAVAASWTDARHQVSVSARRAVNSFGSCRAYRKWALRRAGLKPEMQLLDVATGTGLAAQAALDLGLSPSQIVGLDPSAGMLRENQKRRDILLVQGMGENLPFCEGAFDFICMGYALRHVEDLNVLFREFHRVLLPTRKPRVLP